MNWAQMLFQDWQGVGRTIVVGTLGYIVLILFVRISGKRTLAKLNAFDLVVTVALGSTLATVLLNRDVALAEGALAFALLVGLQFLITWSSVRLSWIRRLVTGDPVLLFHRGRFLERAMRGARVNAEDLRAAVRGAGKMSMEEVEAVVLETDGSFSVLPASGREAGDSAMHGVRGRPDPGS